MESRHLYYDQQKPLEELLDAEHATISPVRFSSHDPTIEDAYFFDEDQYLLQKAAELEAVVDVLWKTPEPPADEPWQRFSDAVSAGFDTHWRP